jgi:hypothetical protein
MEKVAITSPREDGHGDFGGLDDAGRIDTNTVDARAAPRITLLIRAAKLVAHNGEFVCVIRDVSETGISVRLFHKLPTDELFELHMPGGAIYVIRRVWERNNEAGFQFTTPIDVEAMVNEASEFPKRGLRLGIHFPVQINTAAQSCQGIAENFSQQGARIECNGLFAIDQNVRLAGVEGTGIPGELRAKVRWRRDSCYGVVFDDTFTLGDFARLAAKMQHPRLLED